MVFEIKFSSFHPAAIFALGIGLIVVLGLQAPGGILATASTQTPTSSPIA